MSKAIQIKEDFFGQAGDIWIKDSSDLRNIKAVNLRNGDKQGWQRIENLMGASFLPFNGLDTDRFLMENEIKAC